MSIVKGYDNTIVSAAIVSAGKEKIMLNLKKESWISDNDFKAIIKLSFPFSLCCNAYVKGKTLGVDVLFNQFIKNFKYEYTVQSLSYDCHAYFGLASSENDMMNKVKERVPTSISTTELLLIIDDKITSNSSILDVSIYKNSNVNIISRSGYWTLSENYLFPRVFKKVKRLKELRHKRGIVDLQGRQLQVAAFYNPPFCYLSTTINQTINKIDGEFFLANDDRELDGIETKLFLLMSKRLNFTWKIRKPNHYFRYGRPNGSNWEGGMIGQLFRNEIDFAFSGIWLKHDQYQYVNLTEPWYQLLIHYLVPRPRPQTSIWALTRPFTIEVWLLLIVVIIIQSINITIKARINQRVPKKFKSFILTITELLNIGSWSPLGTYGLRLQIHLWHVYGILIVTAYSSSLASRLTTPDYEPRIDTIQQFIDKNLTWGREAPVPNFDDYFNLRDPYAGKFPDKFTIDIDEEDRHVKIKKGNYAIIGRIVQGIFFPENHIRDADLKNYRVMKQEVGDYYATFAVQPWLLHSINKMVLWLRECGFTKYHLTNVIHRRTSLSLRNVLEEHDIKNNEGARVLILKPLIAGFGFFLIGLFISTLVLIYELRKKYPT
ncbi:uncharacterized protein LOC122847798, partial [Aphidius gifuensis]|uniref:uncharacterized protein LOC122847798 n=1 Tax=Aphidius gifuensis TaxID=684658 RepID=UPI001CDD3A71